MGRCGSVALPANLVFLTGRKIYLLRCYYQKDQNFYKFPIKKAAFSYFYHSLMLKKVYF